MYEVLRGIGKFIVKHPDGDREFTGPGAKSNAYAWAQESYREDLKADSQVAAKSDEGTASVEPARDFLTDTGPGVGSRRGNYERGSQSRGGGA